MEEKRYSNLLIMQITSIPQKHIKLQHNFEQINFLDTLVIQENWKIETSEIQQAIPHDL
jgi:hypothetical protein